MKKMTSQSKFKADVFLNGDYAGESREIYYDYEPIESYHLEEYDKVVLSDLGKTTITIVFPGWELKYDSNVAETILTHFEEPQTMFKKHKIKVKSNSTHLHEWYDWTLSYNSYSKNYNTWNGFVKESKKSVTLPFDWNSNYYYFYPPDSTVYDSHGYINESFFPPFSRPSEVDKLPGLKENVRNPVNGTMDTLERVIIRLNDSERWSREQIADWLETLDVNINFKVGTNE